MQVRKQQLELDMEQQTCSKFNFYVEYIMRNAGLEETQSGIKIVGRNINNLRYANDTTLMAESKEELKSFLMKVKEESGKVDLKFHIQKTKSWHPAHHFMANRWGNRGNSIRLYFGGSKITADGDCSHEIKTLTPWKESYDQP